MKRKVKTKWGINIGGEGEFLVKLNDRVVEGQLLVKVRDKKVSSFDFSGFLGKMGSEKIAALNEKFTDSWVDTGELICMRGGIFPSKICFPMKGRFLGLDEMGVLRIEQVEETERKILSPVDGRVCNIERDKISLEFEVDEFKGDGLIGGKTWGKGEVKIINENKNLDFSLKGSLLFTENLSKIFLLKAEVVGVTGVVTNKKYDDDLLIGLPVLYLNEIEWKELMKYNKETRNFLLNSRIGRLLMVLE